jgi:hypothetical protein
LTTGQKTLLRDLVRQKKYGYRSYVTADQMEKGILVEKEARDLMSDVLDTVLVKDDERRSNEYVTGCRDIKHDSIIIDIKSAFTQSSFSRILDESYTENEIYLRQMDCYMELWECDKSIVAHVLVDSPIHIVENQIGKVMRRDRLFNTFQSGRLKFTAAGMQLVRGIVHDHIVTDQGMKDLCAYGFQYYGNEYFEFKRCDFPDWKPTAKAERIHMITHDYQHDRIKQRNECINIAREYMNTVQTINNLIQI